MASRYYANRGKSPTTESPGGNINSNSNMQPTGSGKLPLPDDYFRVPTLNGKETKYLINLAKRACKEVVFYSRTDGGPMNWVHLSSGDGVEIFQGINATMNAQRNVTYLRGATRIYATIDEIADFFRLDTASKLSGFTQTVGKDLLDQKTLYNLAMPTPENPKHYVGIKWTAVESPSKLARNRDFCYLECHDEFIDTNSKKRGWVRSLHSIRLPFCPDLNKSHGLVRGSLYRSGFVFLESDDRSYVDAVHTLHMDIKGNAPTWLKILVMKRRIKNIAEVNRYFQMRRLCEGPLLSEVNLPSKSGVGRCQLCSSKFGLFGRKSTCRKCGKVICTACGHNFILDYAATGAKKVRICSECADHVVHGASSSRGGDVLMSDRPVSHIQAKRCNDDDETVTRPIYDQTLSSPSSSSSHNTANKTRNGSGSARQHRRQQQIAQIEQEYYRNNEDDRGMADIMEAQRMEREFEEHFSRSKEGRKPIVLDDDGLNVAMSNGTIRGTAIIGETRKKSVSNAGRARKPSVASHLDDHSEDAELGLPKSKREQVQDHEQKRQQLSHYQEFMRQERARQLSRAGGSTRGVVKSAPSRRPVTQRVNSSPAPASSPFPQPGEFIHSRNIDQSYTQQARVYSPVFSGASPPDESLESIRISSDWRAEYVPPLRSRFHLGNNTILSDETVGAPIRRSDLSMDRESRSSKDLRSSLLDSERSASFFDEDYVHRRHAATLPPAHTSYPSPIASSADSFRSADNYCDDSLYTQQQQPKSLEGIQVDDKHFRELRRSYFDARNSDIRDLEQRVAQQPVTDTEDEEDFRYGYDGQTSGSASFASVAGGSADYTKEYEVPLPDDLSTTKNTKRSPTRSGSSNASKRTAEELATVMALSAMRLYEKENGLGIQVSDVTRQAALKKMVEIYASELEQNSFVDEQPRPQQQSRNGARNAGGFARSDERALLDPHASSGYMEYRDLSDLSASAFIEYQRETMYDGGSDRSYSADQPSVGSSVAGTAPRRPSIPDSRASSRQNTLLGLHDTDDRSRGAGTTHGTRSLPDSEQLKATESRPNSVRGDESDTFSEIDLIDLPHLMRADEGTSPQRDGERLSHESHQTMLSEPADWQEPEGHIVANPSVTIAFIDDNDGGHDVLEQRLSETHPDSYPFPQERPRISSDRLGDSLTGTSFPAGWTTSVSMSHGYSVGPSEANDDSTPPGMHADDLDTSLADTSLPSDDVLSACDSDEADFEIGYHDSDDTTRSKMTLSELERYRASLAELMAEYNEEHNRRSSSSSSPNRDGGMRFFSSQPEREPDYYSRSTSPNDRGSRRSPAGPKGQTQNLEHVLQELYL